MSTTRKLFLAGAICATSFRAFAQVADTSAAREIARIDEQYSNLSVGKGMPAASLEYFAEEEIAFAPTAVNGKKYWGGRSDFPGTLIWRPSFAFAAHATDLGYTTGPWELKKGTEPISIAFGHYVTVWAKQRSGQWKIALDVGTENPQPYEPPADLQLLPPDITAGKRPLDIARHSLQKTQRKFLAAARNDIGKTIIDHASDDIRIYREKSFPAIGVAAANLMLGSDHGKVVREFGGSSVSSSGDLSYSYGNYSEERGNTVEHGIYLMIWRINLNGDWKLALDLQKKLPPKT